MFGQIEKMKSLLQQEGLDAILAADPYNIRYLSGFRGGSGYLFLTKERSVLLTDSRYTTQAREETEGCEILEVSGQRPYETCLKELCEQENVSLLGFEDTFMTYFQVEKLRKEIGVQKWQALGEKLNQLRIIKSSKELECIRRAEAIGDEAFSYILGELRPGMTEIEAALLLEGAMRKKGAEGLSFDTIVASGLHSAMPHAIPDEKQIEAGDFVTMDFGCIYQGYCSDMTRTVVMGKASQKQRELYKVVLEAQEAALELICAGRTGREVDEVARGHIAAAGYGAYFGHGLGHSLGLFIHEEPRLSPREERVLEPGMVMTVEPGIYIPGFGGVRIEDLVEIKEVGCENYTHSEKRLIEL